MSRSADNEFRVMAKLVSQPAQLSWPLETFVHRSGFVVGLHGGEWKHTGVGGHRALRRCVEAGWVVEGMPAQYSITQRGYRELERRKQAIRGRAWRA